MKYKCLIGFTWLWLLSLTTFSVYAQDSTQATTTRPTNRPPYKTALGIQLTGVGSAFANPKGVSFKYFAHPHTALEFNLTPGGRNLVSSNAAGLRHFALPDAPQLNWYAGAGINFELYRYPQHPQVPDPAKQVTAHTTTLMGVLGAEYYLPNLPFTLAADIKKGFFGFTYRGATNRYNIINGLRPCLSFRYTFKS